jgi:hypothetical protein
LPVLRRFAGCLSMPGLPMTACHNTCRPNKVSCL